MLTTTAPDDEDRSRHFQRILIPPGQGLPEWADYDTSVSTNPRSEREAQREVLRDALLSLTSGSKQTDSAVDDVLRAIDVYIDRNASEPTSSREPPVANFDDRNERNEIRWATWLVVGGAVVATIAVAFLISGGGWPTGLAVLAVWIAALFALTQT